MEGLSAPDVPGAADLAARIEGALPYRPGLPTITDVAALAGVSPMTVSRVLHGGKNVRPDKVKLVTDAVATLGYRRNENARSIRPGQRTGLVGVIITNVSNPYYAEVQQGIEEVLSAEEMRILVGNSGDDVAKERALVDDFVGRQVDGLIVVPSSGGEIDGAGAGGGGHLDAVRLAGIPLVLASRELPGIHADTVLIDDVTGAYEGTKRLIAKGHTRIAYIGNLVSVFTSRRRFDGFTRAHDEAGLTVDPLLVRAGPNDSAAARGAMLDLLGLEQPPTAVFGANNRNTVGVLRAIVDAGLDPRAIRIIGFDSVELSDVMPFDLSVIDHDARELGRTAGRMIVDRSSGMPRSAPARIVELPTHLIVN